MGTGKVRHNLIFQALFSAYSCSFVPLFPCSPYCSQHCITSDKSASIKRKREYFSEFAATSAAGAFDVYSNGSDATAE